ncbi:MAG: type II toxin-antitoxin system Phd/YefM family antitoxin [Bacillota bacterium]|nr:type II toxin-antitoxin system Phd/YefM family antitoxin [Bacillota bacterium]
MTLSKEQYIVDTSGKKRAVVLSLERYRQLLEDLHDLAVVAERREEKPVGLTEVKQRLKEDGII